MFFHLATGFHLNREDLKLDGIHSTQGSKYIAVSNIESLNYSFYKSHRVPTLFSRVTDVDGVLEIFKNVSRFVNKPLRYN